MEKKKCFGGSARAGAVLLPPARDGPQSRAAVRDGNALPLGRPSDRGGTGIHPAPIFRFSLPLPGRARAAPAERGRRGIQDLPRGLHRTVHAGQDFFNCQEMTRVSRMLLHLVGTGLEQPPYLSKLARTRKFAPSAFSFGPCNCASVGGSAALRMRHTPCGYGPFVSGLSAAASGGWPPTRACERSLFGATEKKMGGGGLPSQHPG